MLLASLKKISLSIILLTAIPYTICSQLNTNVEFVLSEKAETLSKDAIALFIKNKISRLSKNALQDLLNFMSGFFKITQLIESKGAANITQEDIEKINKLTESLQTIDPQVSALYEEMTKIIDEIIKTYMEVNNIETADQKETMVTMIRTAAYLQYKFYVEIYKYAEKNQKSALSEKYGFNGLVPAGKRKKTVLAIDDVADITAKNIDNAPKMIEEFIAQMAEAQKEAEAQEAAKKA